MTVNKLPVSLSEVSESLHSLLEYVQYQCNDAERLTYWGDIDEAETAIRAALKDFRKLAMKQRNRRGVAVHA